MSNYLKRLSKKLRTAVTTGQIDPEDQDIQQLLGDYEIMGFVKLPKPTMLEDFQSVQLQTHTLAESGETQGAMLSIEAAMLNYRKNGDPITALRVFCDSMENGLYPPVEVLEFLRAAFNEYRDKQGTISMDKAMNLAAGKGQTPPFKRALMRQRDEMLMMDIDLLMVLGFSREKAAEAVTVKLKSEDWNHSLHDMADIDADTIADRHKRAFRPQLEDVEFTKKIHHLDTDNGVHEYLSHFPNLSRG